MNEKMFCKVLTVLGPVVELIHLFCNLLVGALGLTRRLQETKRRAVKVFWFVLLVLTMAALILTLWGALQVMGQPVMGVEHCTIGNGCVQQFPFTWPGSPVAGVEHCPIGNGCMQQIPITWQGSPVMGAEHCTIGNGCVQRNG